MVGPRNTSDSMEAGGRWKRNEGRKAGNLSAAASAPRLEKLTWRFPSPIIEDGETRCTIVGPRDASRDRAMMGGGWCREEG